ncbi:MAG: hypothetical protein ACFFBQ_17530 [Promethearchaeota archaeon]
MNINDFKRLYRRVVTGQGGDAGLVYLELDRVKAGWRRVLTHVTVEDLDNDCTKYRLAIKHLNRLHYLDEITDPESDELCVARSDIVLGEQDIFCAEITGSTDGDTLRLCAIGWEAPLK